MYVGLPSYVSVGEGLQHGAMRNVTCAKGFVPTEEHPETVTCDDGRWSRAQLQCLGPQEQWFSDF